jgi:hypothetical protein
VARAPHFSRGFLREKWDLYMGEAAEIVAARVVKKLERGPALNNNY